MPIYEYKCTDCGHEMEAIQKIGDKPLVMCPSCDRESLKKLVSASSFRLKGGGWYETDFKKDNKKRIADSGDGGSNTKSSADSAGTGKTGDTTGAASKAGSKTDTSSSK